MREYELSCIIQPEISDEGVVAPSEKLEGILETEGGHKLFYDDMGKRRLGYPIRRFQKGHYLTLFFIFIVEEQFFKLQNLSVGLSFVYHYHCVSDVFYLSCCVIHKAINLS